MTTFNQTIFVSQNGVSAGQLVDFKGEAVSNVVITNNSGFGIQYSTGGAFITVANGATATVGNVDGSLFRIRKQALDAEPGYPIRVEMSWNAGDDEIRVSGAAGGSFVYEAGGQAVALGDDQSLDAASASFNQSVSAATALADYEDNAAIVEPWADLTAWTLGAAGVVQVSAGRLFSTSTGGGSSGLNRSYALTAGQNMRAVFHYRHVLVAISGGGVIIGVNSNAAGAIPGSAGANSFGLYFRSGVTQWVSSGVFTDLIGAPAMRATDYIVTVTVDQQFISVVARSVDGLDEFRARRVRAGFPVNNLYIFNSDARSLTGHSVGFVGARRQFGSIVPRTGIEGVGSTAHWSGDGVQNFKLTLPAVYDTRIPVPVCVMFHGNGSDENHFADNANGEAASLALLNAGYAVLTCTFSANLSTWGAQASLDAYKAAFRFFRARYALGAVVYYGNSMGGLEAINSLAEEAIPGVLAVATTHAAFSLSAAFANGFTAPIRTAYGIAGDNSNYDAATADHDPMLLPASRLRGVPLWLLYATDDTTVPPAAHSIPFVARVSGAVKSVAVSTTTGGHSASIAAFTASMVAFFNQAIGR